MKCDKESVKLSIIKKNYISYLNAAPHILQAAPLLTINDRCRIDACALFLPFNALARSNKICWLLSFNWLFDHISYRDSSLWLISSRLSKSLKIFWNVSLTKVNCSSLDFVDVVVEGRPTTLKADAGILGGLVATPTGNSPSDGAIFSASPGLAACKGNAIRLFSLLCGEELFCV
jgi:hypothetical protein